MKGTVRHDRAFETAEAKALWFRSLSLRDRMEILCSFTDLALEVNPRLKDMKHVEPIEGRIQVLTASRS